MKKGFTLTELLVAVTISTLIMVVIIDVYVNSLKALDSSLKIAQTTNNAQLGLEQMVREIREARVINSIVPKQIGGPNGHMNIIHFHTTDDPNIAYNLKNNTLCWNSNLGHFGPRIIARNVSSITLVGYKADGATVTTIGADVRTVEITLVTTDDRGGSQQIYRSRIRVRSL